MAGQIDIVDQLLLDDEFGTGEAPPPPLERSIVGIKWLGSKKKKPVPPPLSKWKKRNKDVDIAIALLLE